MSVQEREIPLAADDGHQFKLIARIPAQAHASVLWLPALGVAAKHYLPLADALAANGVAVFLHEMRGNGSSNLRADRRIDWGYREILATDIACSDAAVATHCPASTRIIGGHSIGAQFAACYLALHPHAFQTVVADRQRLPVLAKFPGAQALCVSVRLPVRAVDRGPVRQPAWAPARLRRRRSAHPDARLGQGRPEQPLCGHGDGNRLRGRLVAGFEVGVRAVLMSRDWFAPRRSMQGLLDKLPRCAFVHHHPGSHCAGRGRGPLRMDEATPGRGGRFAGPRGLAKFRVCGASP